MKSYIRYLCLFTFIVSLGACSLVKDPTASSNFSRVKYNSHVKLAKVNRKGTPTITSTKLSKTPRIAIQKKDIVTAATEGIFTDKTINRKQREENVVSVDKAKQEVVLKTMVEQITKQGIEESVIVSKQTQKSLNSVADDWWERDVEDWPWLEIVLALIAFLLIIIVVSLLVSVLGGLISSLLGLILLLVLAYILYTLWF